MIESCESSYKSTGRALPFELLAWDELYDKYNTRIKI